MDRSNTSAGLQMVLILRYMRMKSIVMKRINRFKTSEAINDLEKHLVSSFTIASNSFDDLASGVKPSWWKKMKAWSIIVSIVLGIGLCSFLIYHDDLDYYLMFGMPVRLIH